MQVETLFITQAEPREYDFKDESSGRRVQGTTYKVGIWSGKEGEMPGEIKLADADVHQRVKRLKLKTLEPILVTYDVNISNGRPYLGKVIAIDRVQETVPA
jgi:hypothetical protein